MKLLLAHPGADWSTADVHAGLRKALAAQGHEIVDYALNQRIWYSSAWLNWLWQHKFRKEGYAKPTSADCLYEASFEVVERALRFQVDWVIVVSAMYLHPDVFVLLKRAGQRVAVVLTESPYDDEKQIRILPFVDCAWTNERTSVPILRQANPNVYYLPHAYDPELHRPDLPVGDEVPAHDVVFVGTGFPERIELLSAVDWTGIDLGLYGSWVALGSRNPLRRFLRGKFTDNDVTAQLYRKAKIGLNLHRQSKGFGRNAPRITTAESLNPRAYELAACGVFQLSDRRLEVLSRFGLTVPMFTDATDLERQIRLYLADDGIRAERAQAAHGCVAGQTFAARAEQMLADLARVSKPRLAAVP